MQGDQRVEERSGASALGRLHGAQHQPIQSFGPLRGHMDGDHAAHGMAKDMNPFETERIEKRQAVIRHQLDARLGVPGFSAPGSAIVGHD